MMSLPVRYREFLDRYERAYHTPGHVASEKQVLWEQSSQAMLRSEFIPSELARELHLDVANLNAYLMRGETQRFTLDTARTIAQYLTA